MKLKYYLILLIELVKELLKILLKNKNDFKCPKICYLLFIRYNNLKSFFLYKSISLKNKMNFNLLTDR